MPDDDLVTQLETPAGLQLLRGWKDAGQFDRLLEVACSPPRSTTGRAASQSVISRPSLATM